MFPLQFIGKFIKILHSAATPGQIAGGFILGMIIGLTPFWSLHNMIIILLILLLNVNLAMSIFSFALFSMFAYLLDPVFHQFGYWLLADLAFLKGFYTSLYNIRFFAMTNFNNTVVMGSSMTAVILLFPVYLLVHKGIIQYRESVLKKIEQLKIVKAIKGTKVYGWYAKYAEWRS